MRRRLGLFVALDPLQEQRQRSVALAPYLVTAPKRGVIGNSRYAQRLRREIVQASRDKERYASTQNCLHNTRGSVCSVRSSGPFSPSTRL